MANVFLSEYKGHLFYPKMDNNVGKKGKDNKKKKLELCSVCLRALVKFAVSVHVCLI